MAPRLLLLLPLVVLVLLTFLGWIGVNAIEQLYQPNITLCNPDSSDGYNFSVGSVYQANRDVLVHSLCTGAATNGGFLNMSYGDRPDQVFGIAMCYISSSWDECKKCLDRAPSYVSTACPNSSTGALMYDKCILRYSDQPFFSVEIDQGPVYDEYIEAYVDDMVTMNNSRWRMMNRLIPAAAAAPRRFANGSELYKDSVMTYGLVQCRMDLGPDECTDCLSHLVEYLLNTFPNNTAAAAVQFSCYVQYQDAPISLMNPPALPPAPQSLKKDGSKLHLITVLAASTATSTILLCLALALLLWVFLRWWPKKMAKDEMELEFSNGAGPKRFDYSVLAVAACHFADDRKLGEGGFGSVYRGFLAELNLDVAIKRVSRSSNQGRKEYASEVTIISRLRHRNLVQLVGWCGHSHDKLLLVYELMPNGSLDAHLYNEEKMLPWSLRYDIILGIGSALLYLHQDCEQGVLHRDIKPSNIMLDASFNAKLGDFGLARFVEHGQGAHTTTEPAGTMGYMDPECASTGRFSTESDIYSFGVVLLEVACGRRPVVVRQDNTVIHLAQRVSELYRHGTVLDAADPRLNGDFDARQMECVLVVGLWCTQVDRSQRPSIRQAVSALRFEVSLPPVPRQNSVSSFILYNDTASSACTIGGHKTGQTDSQTWVDQAGYRDQKTHNEKISTCYTKKPKDGLKNILEIWRIIKGEV